MTAKCPAIQWNKANSAGEALKGTTWNVYGTLEAAKAETSSLGTITDGEFTDGNDADGTIKFTRILCTCMTPTVMKSPAVMRIRS